MKKYDEKIGKARWIHFQDPNDDDIAETTSFIKAHPLILKELQGVSDRSKIENYGSYLFAVYHLHIYDIKEKKPRRTEIDILASKETILTYTYETIEPVDQFKSDIAQKLDGKIQNASQIIYYLLQEINVYSLRQLRHVEEKVNVVGNRLFDHGNRYLLEDISYIKRDLLEFEITAASQKSTLESLLTVGEEFYGLQSKIYFSDLMGSLSRVHYLLETLRVTVISYSETVSQVFQSETSEVMRRFSILGFLTFPLLLFTTIALQPTVEPTLFRTPADFWNDLLAVVGIVVILAFIFRKKRWL
jgi:magnesium transporter